MKISIASSAELYAEHRRTASRRKRGRIAAELQRRHDEQNQRPGYDSKVVWWTTFPRIERTVTGFRTGVKWVSIPRFDFALWLP